MNLLNSRGNWLLISIQVIQTIVTEFTTFNLQKAFTTEFENILAIILITTVIRIRLSEIPCESSRDNLRLFEQKFRGRKGAISLSFRFETKVQ